MARIRSTHPGQWSDEDFVQLSYPARLLALAVRNIADDHGIFEWKPITLKMQLFPADSIEVLPLLDECVTHGMIMKFEAGGKQFGAIRNFMRWQRPKRPTYSHPITPLVLEYVADNAPEAGTDNTSTDDSSEHVPNMSPTSSGIAPQRKEEGGRRNEERGKKKDRGADAPADFAFTGNTIRLKTADLNRWRKSYHGITDWPAALTKADDYFTQNPPHGGKWFFPLSRWLEREHQAVIDKKSVPENDPYSGVEF